MKILKITDTLYDGNDGKWKWRWDNHTLSFAHVKDNVISINGQTTLCLDGKFIFWWQDVPNLQEAWPTITEVLLMHNIVCEPANMATTQYPVDDMLSPN